MPFNPEGLALSEGYARTMRDEVLPYNAARGRERIVKGDGGRPLYTVCCDADAPRGTVLIVHGFTENADKYAEIIYALLVNGLSVVAYDQRGHGRSWRPEGLEEISLTHVDSFDEYVRDMEIVCRQVLADMPKPHRVLCHSMGGAVTALYLEAHPGEFDRVAMCAPMIAPNLNGIPRPAALLMCQTEKKLGHSKRRIVGSKPYAGERFEDAAANGRERFEWYEALRKATPAFQNNGPTYGWTLEAIRVTDAILAPGAVERIDAKVRLYTAEQDGSVLPGPQGQFIERVRDGERITVANTRHEIYRAPDAVLFPWWRDVLSFLSN